MESPKTKTFNYHCIVTIIMTGVVAFYEALSQGSNPPSYWRLVSGSGGVTVAISLPTTVSDGLVKRVTDSLNEEVSAWFDSEFKRSVGKGRAGLIYREIIPVIEDSGIGPYMAHPTCPLDGDVLRTMNPKWITGYPSGLVMAAFERLQGVEGYALYLLPTVDLLSRYG